MTNMSQYQNDLGIDSIGSALAPRCVCVCACVCFLCSFIQSAVDTVLNYHVCVYAAAHIQLDCMLYSGGHVCGRRNGWGQTESSAREYLVSGALQEMKNENESGWGGEVVVVRGALVIGGGCHF